VTVCSSALDMSLIQRYCRDQTNGCNKYRDPTNGCNPGQKKTREKGAQNTYKPTIG
jgi:hypothetical protein